MNEEIAAMLAPSARQLVEMMAAADAPKVADLPPAEARMAYEALRPALDMQDVPVAKVEQLEIPGPAGPIPAAAFHPAQAGEAPLPVIVFFHGGGWVIGSISTHEQPCRYLANASGAVVISVDYRLAPEHVFPAAVDDAMAATSWIAANAGELGVDAARLFVSGDSAGGNLAAIVAQQAKAKGGPAVMGQALIYPATDFVEERASRIKFGQGLFLERETMTYFENHYMPPGADKADPRLSPIRADDLSGLPPAYILVAGLDPLHDEGLDYAAALEAAGVPVTSRDWAGQVHGFINMGGMVPEAPQALDAMGAWIKQTYGG